MDSGRIWHCLWPAGEDPASGDLLKGSGQGCEPATSFVGSSRRSCWKASEPTHDRQRPAPGLLWAVYILKPNGPN